MLNYVIVAGKLCNMDNIDTGIISISVSRPYKNENGEYGKDIIDLDIGKNNIKNDLKLNDTIGVRGSLVRNNIGVMVKADTITYISSKKD